LANQSGIIGDGVTNENALVLSGVAEAGSTVQVFDGTNFLGSASADGTGVWSFATAALIDGTHALSAVAIDDAGNTSGTSQTVSVNVDTSAPYMPLIASFTNDSGIVGDGVTNATSLTLAGTAAAGSTVFVYDGATLLGNSVAGAGGGWSFDTASLAEGSHAFTVRAVDEAGNSSPVSPVANVVVDITAPDRPAIVSVLLT
jgi:hypothetical protein